MSAKWRISPPRVAFRVAGAKAFAEAGITHKRRSTNLMIYDAFAHLPIYGLEDLGFVPRGEAGAFIAEHNTPPLGGKLPLTPMAAALFLHAFRHVRHVRAAGERPPDARPTAPAQIPGAKISVCHGVGACSPRPARLSMSNDPAVASEAPPGRPRPPPGFSRRTGENRENRRFSSSELRFGRKKTTGQIKYLSTYSRSNPNREFRPAIIGNQVRPNHELYGTTFGRRRRPSTAHHQKRVRTRNTLCPVEMR